MRRRHYLGLLGVFVLLFGVVAGVMLIRDRTGFRIGAFTDFAVNSELVQTLVGTSLSEEEARLANISPLTAIPGSDETRSLFHSLTTTYPNASTQNIDPSVFGIGGTASLAYDREIDTTLIFIRLENMPFFETSPLGMWLFDGERGSFVASSEFFVEDGQAVAYTLYSAPGDLREQFDEAVMSYDFVGSQEPALPIITLTL